MAKEAAAKPVPRLHIFYGSDSRASLAEVRRWTGLFHKKYGETTRFVLDADDMPVDQVRQELERQLLGQTLFAQPKLILVRRLAVADPKKGKALVPLLAWLEGQTGLLDESVTLMFWEERDLPADHALALKAEEWARAGKAAVRRYAIPGPRELAAVVRTHLEAAGKSIDREAMVWLAEQYQFLDRRVRLQQRLRSDQSRLDDERGWWLFNLLEGASLRSAGSILTVDDLRHGHAALGQPVGAFDIAASLASLRWADLRRQITAFAAAESDDSAYFGLYAALAWQAQRGSARLQGSLRAHALRLLGEIEVVSKSAGLGHAWLLERFVTSLQRLQEEGAAESLLDLRKLWLAALPRS